MSKEKRFGIIELMMLVAGIASIILSSAIFTVVINRRLSPPSPLSNLKVQFKIEGRGDGATAVTDAIRATLIKDGAQMVTVPAVGVRVLKGTCYVGYRNPKLPRPSTMDMVFSVSDGHSVFVKTSPIEAVRDGSGILPLREEMVNLLAQKASNELRAQLHGREPTPYIIHGMP